ncbi:MAG: hypothetical protein AAF633_09620 [Chloroflexota bacterium]
MENIQDILAQHADGLITDHDLTQKLLDQYKTKYANLPLLFQIAHRLKDGLVPQLAPADFVALLRNDLRAFDEMPEFEPMSTGRRGRTWVFWGGIAGAAGTIAGVVGLILWLRNRADSALTPESSTA